MICLEKLKLIPIKEAIELITNGTLTFNNSGQCIQDPSLRINIKDNYINDFGNGTSYKGNIINFYEQYKNYKITYNQAIKELCNIFNIEMINVYKNKTAKEYFKNKKINIKILNNYKIIINDESKYSTIKYSYYQYPDQFIGYKIVNPFKYDKKGNKYSRWDTLGLNNPLFCIQLINNFDSNKPLYICEGEPDTLTLLQNGYQAIGISGKNGLSETNVSKYQYKENVFDKFEKIILCFDKDVNQDTINKTINLIGKSCYYLDWKKYKGTNNNPKLDINDLFIESPKTFNIEDYISNKPFKYKNKINNLDNKDTKNEFNYSKLPFSFWTETNGKLSIKHSLLIEYIKSLGINIIENPDNVTDRVLVHIKDNIVKQIDVLYIKKLVSDNINNISEDFISPNCSKAELKEIFEKGINVYINEDKINLVNHIYIDFKKDTKDKAFFYFNNVFIEVSKQGINLKNYKELDSYIWESQKIKHNFIYDNALIKNYSDFNFLKFLKNICSLRDNDTIDFDKNRFKALINTIGYLLHSYKTSSNKKAITLTEASLDDKAQGRTGKGLLIKAISKLRNTVTIDGKNFSFDSQFAFQNVELDTQIIFFDDVKPNFNFQRLYSAITEGLSFEKKHKQRINLSPENSPKIVISSNYAIKGNSESDKGRKYELELLRYYNSNYTPDKEFKEVFFDDWNNEEWNRFYNIMINCTKEYLSNSNEIPKYKSSTLEQKKIIMSTSPEFLEYAESKIKPDDYICNELYNDFLEYIDDDNTKLTKITFGKWIKDYCEYKELTFKTETIWNNKSIKMYIIR